MSRTKPEDLSKLQVVCSLFSKTVGNDLFFAQQIKESIEASLSTEDQTPLKIYRAGATPTHADSEISAFEE